MLSEREKQELHILKTIAQSPEPIGSGSLCDQLLQAGVNISEATVGRILRQFDLKNYTIRVGYQGRRLTAEGEARLQQLAQINNEALITDELRQSLRLQDKHTLVDALVARRAVEREIARLAATNITEDELMALRDCVRDHAEHIQKGESVTYDDLIFHRIIAKASHNRILEASLELIRQNWQNTPVLAYIRYQANHRVVPDHQRIVTALEQRSPQAAEEAVVRHLEGLIQDVENFWEIAQRSTSE